MSLDEIENIHYIKETTLECLKKFELTKEEQVTSDSGKLVIEDNIEYDQEPLPSNDKSKLCCAQVYSQYCLSTEDSLDNTLSNLDLADYNTSWVNTQLYNPNIKTPHLPTYSKNDSKNNNKPNSTSIIKVKQFEKGIKCDAPLFTTLR